MMMTKYCADVVRPFLQKNFDIIHGNSDTDQMLRTILTYYNNFFLRLYVGVCNKIIFCCSFHTFFSVEVSFRNDYP